MINPQELRIGNYVADALMPEIHYQVFEIMLDEIVVGQSQEQEKHNIVSKGLITSIPLTEGWLKRLGGKRYNGPLNPWWQFDKFLIRLNEHSVCISDADLPDQYLDIDAEIQYVHQLQNLFFAITGEELKVGE